MLPIQQPPHLTLESHRPAASWEPSGEKARPLTRPAPALMVQTGVPSVAAHSLRGRYSAEERYWPAWAECPGTARQGWEAPEAACFMSSGWTWC